MKKLFAMLFAAALLTFAVGCPPATPSSTTHSTIKSSSVAPMGTPGGSGMPGGSHMGSGMTTKETHEGGGAVTHKEVTPPSETKKEGAETKKETKETKKEKP